MDEKDSPDQPAQQEYTEPSEATLIVDSNSLKKARAQAAARQQQAYVIVIAGPHTGKMFKLESSETSLGRSPNVDLQLQDVGVSRQHARLIRMGTEVYLEDLQSANGTFLNGERVVTQQQLHDGDKITLGSTTILKFTYHDRLDEDFQKKMFDAALRDGLTGAYNKKFFTNHLYTEVSYAQRHNTSLCLIMIDVDHFKDFNDNYGHLAGDAILVQLARITQQSIRTEDAFARYGGEEFAIIARGITTEQGRRFAERLRTAVNQGDFRYDGQHMPITISLGVASYPEIDVENGEQLISAADAALYRAKGNGRNRVEIAR